MGKILINFLLFHIISILLLIISYILILIQNIENIIFYCERSKKIIAEKFIYEQFSHEIYSNINSKIYYNISETPKNDNCQPGYDIIKFPIYIDSFYDCENIDNNNIDKNECLGKVTSNRLCCEENCCKDKVFEKERYHFCDMKSNFNQNDPRNGICPAFSLYNGKFYYINQKKFCAKRFNKTYEELLTKINETADCDIKFDSMGHKFCSFDYNDYNFDPNESIIVENIFSVFPPNHINIKNSYRVSLLLNKNKFDESKIYQELNKQNEITPQNIREAFFKNEEDFSSCPTFYEEKKNFKLNDLISGDEPVFKNYKNDNLIKKGNITWYTRSYIGFTDLEQLKKFKKNFDENDHKNNSLYKLSTSDELFYISLVSIIIIFLLLIFHIIYLIYILKKDKKININNIPFDEISFCFVISSSITFVFYLIIYLACFICKYDYIDIDMEGYLELVIQKYNKRRKQIYLLYSFIPLVIHMVASVLLFCFSKFFNKNKIINIRPNNILLVKFRLKEGNCEHKIKIDKNKTLQQYINNIEKIFDKCRKCSDKFFSIDNISLNGRVLNKEIRIETLNIKDNDLLIIEEDD